MLVMFHFVLSTETPKNNYESNKNQLKNIGYTCYKNVLTQNEIHDFITKCKQNEYTDLKNCLLDNNKLKNPIIF